MRWVLLRLLYSAYCPETSELLHLLNGWNHIYKLVYWTSIWRRSTNHQILVLQLGHSLTLCMLKALNTINISKTTSAIVWLVIYRTRMLPVYLINHIWHTLNVLESACHILELRQLINVLHAAAIAAKIITWDRSNI